MSGVAEILFRMRVKGVRLWSECGQLRYQSRAGSITPADLECLQARKAELVAFLEQSRTSSPQEPVPAPRAGGLRVPLAFSQIWWWNCFDLGNRHTSRTIAGTVRISGPLNIAILQRSFRELVHRHEALRTTIITIDNERWQQIEPRSAYELPCFDLSSLPGSDQRREIERLTEEIVYEPVSLGRGPLFAARLLKLGAGDYLAIAALDHIISDATSLDILWREILSGYTQLLTNEHLPPPKTRLQFSDYAMWLHQTNQWWTERHGAYWSERLASARRIYLHLDTGIVSPATAKWQIEPVQLGRRLSADLLELSRREHTTLVMTLLTVYVALLLRWSKQTELIVPMVTMGRPYPQVYDSIGFFSTPLYLRAVLRDDDRFGDLLRRVTREHADASEHYDACRIAAQTPLPEFAWNPLFNWVPQELNARPAESLCPPCAQSGIRVEQQRLEVMPRDQIRWDRELALRLSDTPEGVVGFFEHRIEHEHANLHKFVLGFVRVAELAVTESDRRLSAQSY